MRGQHAKGNIAFVQAHPLHLYNHVRHKIFGTNEPIRSLIAENNICNTGTSLSVLLLNKNTYGNPCLISIIDTDIYSKSYYALRPWVPSIPHRTTFIYFEHKNLSIITQNQNLTR